MGKTVQSMWYSFHKKQILTWGIFIVLVAFFLAGCGISASRSENEALQINDPIQSTPSPSLSAASKPKATPPSPKVLSELNQKTNATENPQKERVVSGTVQIWHSWTGNELAGLQQLISNFQEKNPKVGVDLRYVPPADLPASFISQFGAGGPDLLIGSSEWGPELYDAGVIGDASQIANPKFYEKIKKNALESAVYQNAMVGLPVSYRQGIVIFRNRSILPDALPSLAEYLNAAKNKTRGDIIGAVIDLGFFQSGAFLNACGGSLMDARGFPLFDNASGYCWIDILKSIQESGVPVDFNSDLDLERFKTGKTGFIIAGTWDTASLAEAIGPENLAIDPWPATEKGRLSGYMQTDLIYLSSRVAKENLVASRTLMRYFLSASAQKTLAGSTTGGILPVISVAQLQDRLRQEALTALEGGIPIPASTAMDYYWDPMDAALRSILLENQNPEQALEKAATQIEFQLRDLQFGK